MNVHKVITVHCSENTKAADSALTGDKVVKGNIHNCLLNNIHVWACYFKMADA